MEMEDLLCSLAQNDADWRRLGFNDATSFGFIPKTVAGHPEFAQFVMSSVSSDYNGLKKTVEDFFISQEASLRNTRQ